MSGVVVRLVGVYDAEGTLRGELAYFVRHLVGRAHSALCDVTHGRVHERADWRELRSTLPVPFQTFHRDDQPRAVRDVTAGAAPVVVAEVDDGRFMLLLDGDELERCDGAPERLLEAVSTAVRSNHLVWPLPDTEPLEARRLQHEARDSHADSA